MPDYKLQKFILLFLALSLSFILLFMPGFITLAQSNLLLKIQLKNQEVISSWPNFRRKSLEYSMDPGLDKKVILDSSFMNSIKTSIVYAKIFRDETAFWQEPLYSFSGLNNPTGYCVKLTEIYLRALRTGDDFALRVLGEDATFQRFKIILKEMAALSQNFSGDLLQSQRNLIWFQFFSLSFFALTLFLFSFYIFRKIRSGIHLNSSIIFRELGYPLAIKSLLQKDFEKIVNEKIIEIRKIQIKKKESLQKLEEFSDKWELPSLNFAYNDNLDEKEQDNFLSALSEWDNKMQSSTRDKKSFAELLNKQKEVLKSAIEKWENLANIENINLLFDENTNSREGEKENFLNTNGKVDLKILKTTLYSISKNAQVLGSNAHTEAARTNELSKAFSVIAANIQNLAKLMGKMAKNLETNLSKINLASKTKNKKMLSEINKNNAAKIKNILKESANFSKLLINIKKTAMETHKAFNNLLLLHESTIETLGQDSENREAIFTELKKLLLNHKTIKINLEKNTNFLEAQYQKVEKIKSV